jgi:hypothetical protein
VSARSAALIIALLAGTGGCASVPPRKIYVLDNADDAAVGASAGSAATVLKLGRVLVPDYLDTTEILTRASGHELQSSQTGRWGERLSLGITRTLRADLAVRLPIRIAGPAQSSDNIAGQIRVAVDAFDVWADGRCILTANWTVLEKDARGVVLTGHGSFTTAAIRGGAPGDAAIIAAMANAVSQLADGIASTVKRP